ncbi:MAG: NAD(P)-dependent oxidoreductase [Solirubrobacterales bacterium]
MKLLVTGASGFLGGPTCAELVRRGHDVTALVRRPGSEPENVNAVAGELDDRDSLVRALSAHPPDCVVHLAAENGAQRSARKVERVNVEGTKNLLHACRSDGEPRFVFTSTVVTGNARGELLTERSELPVQTVYGRSKQEGERLVRESGLDWAIVRPSHVYGPGGWYVSEFVKRLRSPGRFAVIGTGKNLWDVVHVDDVATAISDAVERAPAGSLYHVVDDSPTTFYDFIALTARELGVGSPRRIPAWLARLGAGSDPVAAVVRSARSSNAHIKEELGWRPSYESCEQGVPVTVAQLRD